MKETNSCPVCGSNCGIYDICGKCGWENDPVQRENPSLSGGANYMSLDEARAAYKNRKEIH
ncbi:MAG: hypothetical protein IJ461_04105 [Clostridia bacterium]|nr:hypothetical protein [Clostridia bacterium]